MQAEERGELPPPEPDGDDEDDEPEPGEDTLSDADIAEMVRIEQERIKGLKEPPT